MRFAASILSLSVLAAGAAHAQTAAPEPIGSAVVVVNLVTAQLQRDTRTLATGDDVRQNEMIEVGSDASSELRLKDDTKLALGPGSRLLLDRFVYDPDQSGGSIVLNLAKGTFRFITGLADKSAYVIRVPSASITVRGTKFDVFVEDNGRSWLLLSEGGVRVCNDRGTCRNHNQAGKIIPIGDSGDIGKPSRWASLPGLQNIVFDAAFPFIVTAPSIDDSPDFTREDIVGGGPTKPEKPRDAEKGDKDAPKILKAEMPRATGPGKRKAIDKVASYLPELIDRIRDRADDDDEDDDDDDIDGGLSPRGLFGKSHRAPRSPD